MVAHYLTERGREVLVLDRSGVARETSGRGEGNVLVCDKPAGVERDLAIVSRRLWTELGARFPQGRVTAKGSLLMYEGAGGDTAGALEPQLAPEITVRLDQDDLQVDSPGMARALLEGIEVRVGVDVTQVDAHTVTPASGERLRAEHVILAPGPWAAELTGLPVEPRKGQLAALSAPPGMIAHKLIDAAYADSVADEAAELSVATVIEQTLDGDEILVGSSRARVGFDATIDQDVTAAMITRAARFVPALAKLPIARQWCGFRPWLPDHLPAVGQLQSGVWASAGHEGSGVCLAPISGMLIAQLICAEAPLVNPNPLDPMRFSEN
jgi:glycine/D-amino acid oxidase-like deaminating enzyme